MNKRVQVTYMHSNELGENQYWKDVLSTFSDISMEWAAKVDNDAGLKYY